MTGKMAGEEKSVLDMTEQELIAFRKKYGIDLDKITIQSDIPLYSSRSSWIPIAHKMKKGDSVFFKDLVPARSLAQSMKRSHPPIQALFRKVPGGYRVWRLS